MSAPLDLAAVKARSAACKVSHECAHQGYGCERCEAEAVTSAADVPALVAEVERLAAENARLRAVRDAAAEYVAAMRMTDEADGAELDGADVDALGAMDREESAKEHLDAALRAAGGG